jgi:major membrane immunogen (membrane-anchored lipoprotein)
MNVESAIQTIIESSQIHAEESTNGNYKTANKNFDLIQKAVNFLRENNAIEKLKELLLYDNIDVKISAATYLLKHNEPEAVAVLQEIALKSNPFQSFNAEMILQEWKKGNITL